MQRQLLKNLDVTLILTTLVLVGFGLVVIYSATNTFVANDPLYQVKRQLLWVGAGLLAAIVVFQIDYQVFRKWAKIIYAANMLLLVGVLIIAPATQGAERWFEIGPARLQPSEFAKITLIITLAWLLEGKKNLNTFSGLILPCLITLVPLAFILLQPDLGTGLVMIAILFGMLYFAGAKPLHLGILLLMGVLVMALAIYLSVSGVKEILKPYQIRRLTIFIDPYSDPTGDGWNMIQSMIAIGSGSFFGKGIFSGTQTQLNFLPARHTDFIFSVIGEEFGFVGAAFLLFLFFILLWRIMRTFFVSKDRFGSLIAAGVASMMLFHILVNVGMTLGLMPITGITLTFISYGGSSLLTNMICVGLVANISARRKKLRF
jgi:rod shape determining protein RodA